MTKRKGTFDMGVDVRKLIGDTPTSQTVQAELQKKTLEVSNDSILVSRALFFPIHTMVTYNPLPYLVYLFYLLLSNSHLSLSIYR